MRALLLNDTRSEHHIGCELVIENTIRQCANHGITLVGTVPASEPNLATRVEEMLEQVDLILINGEGTMHHDRPRALELCQAAEMATKSGRRVVLFNSCWFDNVELNPFVSSFDLIFCRESRSAVAIRETGAEVTVVPDLVFDTTLPLRKQTEKAQGVVVLDSKHGKATDRLAIMAAMAGYDFVPMAQDKVDRVRRKWLPRTLLKLRHQNPTLLTPVQFLDHLQGYEIVVSARFHGTCLGLLLGMPVVSLATNTPKTASLYEDVGLDSICIVPLADIKKLRRIERVEQLSQRSSEQDQMVNAYVEKAPSRIAAMFHEIAALRIS